MRGRTREEQKVAGYLRKELELKQLFERIDYAFDVIAPKLQEMRELAANNNLEIEVGLDAYDPNNA